MSREQRRDPPDDTFDAELLAEEDPYCPCCGQPGEIIGEPIGGQSGVRLRCVNPLCPGLDPDEGPITWEVWHE